MLILKYTRSKSKLLLLLLNKKEKKIWLKFIRLNFFFIRLREKAVKIKTKPNLVSCFFFIPYIYYN